MGITGVYGVSTFYVLSGLTLYMVYNGMKNFRGVFNFFIKRFFKIYPLLWLSIFLTIFLLNRVYDQKTILLNITGLFGYISHYKYIATESWSIGNELVFYSVFPLILLLNKKIKYSLETFLFLSLVFGYYFAFNVLSTSDNIGGVQWKIYINPLNQLFLFVGGVVIGKYLGEIKNGKIALILITIVLLFIFYFPVQGNQINIVTGWNRFFYSVCAFILTIAFLLFDFKTPKFIYTLFSKLGHISYSIYLIHPIVFWYVAKFISKESNDFIFLITSFSIIISLIVYEFYEKKLVMLGKSLLRKL